MAREAYRVMLGKASAYVDDSVAGGCIGADYGIHEDLTGKLPEDWRTFNKSYIPVFMANAPDKSKVAAGLACGAVWTVAKGMNEGDVVLSPNGSGMYHVGTVAGPTTTNRTGACNIAARSSGAAT